MIATPAEPFAWANRGDNPPVARCGECGRRFDLCDDVEADEWANGHDCEAP